MIIPPPARDVRGSMSWCRSRTRFLFYCWNGKNWLEMRPWTGPLPARWNRSNSDWCCWKVSPASTLPPLAPRRRNDRGRWRWQEPRRRSRWQTPAGSAAPPSPAEPSPGQETTGNNSIRTTTTHGKLNRTRVGLNRSLWGERVGAAAGQKLKTRD